MKKVLRFYILPLVAVLVLLASDQLSKVWAQSALASSDITLIPGVLSLHYLRNTGAAFSILEGKMTFFYILTPIVCLWMIIIFLRLQRKGALLSTRVILVFVLAGAIGNFIDRICFAYVNDFIYFSLINFPVFNVADIYVSISVVILLVLFLFKYSEEDVNLIYDAAKFWKRME